MVYKEPVVELSQFILLLIAFKKNILTNMRNFSASVALCLLVVVCISQAHRLPIFKPPPFLQDKVDELKDAAENLHDKLEDQLNHIRDHLNDLINGGRDETLPPIETTSLPIITTKAPAEEESDESNESGSKSKESNESKKSKESNESKKSKESGGKSK
ncbi:uncharacterized protein LOC132205282 [Neocloeon triangulifer]|uniref:uncharacterized protein LOC132205282 n=1 Tax=Neocloeon triangulifer TaxID=2078957 RepID=UPI00286EDFFE|nr:uncharacterized protein LOC132205282 [Neocloeon triangulifer]